MKYLLLSLLLIGCTPIPECPKITCPEVCSETINETTDMLSIYTLEAGKEPVYIIYSNTQSLDIINCGNLAYGLSTSEQIYRLSKELHATYLTLYITNTTNGHLGGCEDILIDNNIRHVYIYGEVLDEEYYQRAVKWIPDEKLTYYEDGHYDYNYNGNIIDFNNLTVNKITKTDGIEYIESENFI